MLRPPEIEILHDREYKRLVVPCRKCHGTGKISTPVDPFGFDRKIERCTCLQALSVRLRLAEGNVPEEFWGVERLRFEWNLEALERVRAYCADLPGARETGRGWVFCGENGAGKTSFASLILAHAAREGFSVGYLTTQEYLSTIIPAGSDHELAEWFRTVQIADFLVLDELGKEHRKEGGWALAGLDSLIRQRCQNLRPTILISNYPAHEVGRVYGESFMSVLTHRVEFVTFQPGDFRKETVRRRRLGRSE